jgi:hypothetical protein
MPTAEVSTFAGIDVSAHELSVALRRGQGDDKPAMAKFPAPYAQVRQVHNSWKNPLKAVVPPKRTDR